jgi:hypothetical protein
MQTDDKTTMTQERLALILYALAGHTERDVEAGAVACIERDRIGITINPPPGEERRA